MFLCDLLIQPALAFLAYEVSFFAGAAAAFRHARSLTAAGRIYTRAESAHLQPHPKSNVRGINFTRKQTIRPQDEKGKKNGKKGNLKRGERVKVMNVNKTLMYFKRPLAVSVVNTRDCFIFDLWISYFKKMDGHGK